ncbi:hypothetical protein D4R51_04045 [bacterium]|nr:MAG: hypothetical protein D4R51_04045 [bacterium]
MSKYNRNTGKPITQTEIKTIQSLARKNTPTRVIGLKIGRTENSVRKIASNTKRPAITFSIFARYFRKMPTACAASSNFKTIIRWVPAVITPSMI